jgi:integrase
LVFQASVFGVFATYISCIVGRFLPKLAKLKDVGVMARTKTKARGQMRPFTKADVGVIRSKLALRGNSRDVALFETAISSMLRASDLLVLKVGDVVDQTGSVVESFTAQQKKSGKPVPVHLSLAARTALTAHVAQHRLSASSFLFRRCDRAGRLREAPLSTTAYRMLVKMFADLAGYTDTTKFSGHSTRRTKASILYRETRDIAGVRTLLGHASLAHTAAYLGVGRDEALALAAQVEL